MGPNLKVITLLLALTGVILFTDNSAAEVDPFIDEVLYSKDGADTRVLVQSGRDNATFYRYLILDDYSEAPENTPDSFFHNFENRYFHYFSPQIPLFIVSVV